MRGDCLKLHQRRFLVGIRKRIFTERVVKHQNRLPMDVVLAPGMPVFKKRLGSAPRWLGSLVASCGVRIWP